MKKRAPVKNVGEYIEAAAPMARPMLRQLRRAVLAVVPNADEKISYGMPYYGHHGRLAYFAAFTHHVSFYFMGSRSLRIQFSKATAPYRTGTATLRFPLGTRVPIALIRQLVKARARENEARAAG